MYTQGNKYTSLVEVNWMPQGNPSLILVTFVLKASQIVNENELTLKI